MKRLCCALAALLALCFAPAQAEQAVTVFASEQAVSRRTARELAALMERAFSAADVTLAQETDLRALVLADCAPDLAICTPQEAAVWAREGLLLPMDGAIAEGERLAEMVLSACVMEESAFMAPLAARHRQMAVNRRALEELGLDVLLDDMEYPVWLPMQALQVLDELALSGEPGAQLWPAQGEGGGAVLALAQSMYCGPILAEDGVSVQADDGSLIAGVSWLQDMTQAGLIGLAGSREEALERFLAGETAIFFDWTAEDAQRLRASGRHEGIAAMPYPSSMGLPVRAFTLTGAAAFASGEKEKDELLLQLAAFLAEDERAGEILGGRNLQADGAFWLPCIGAQEHAGALLSLFAQAIDRVLLEGLAPGTAMRAVQAAMDARR